MTLTNKNIDEVVEKIQKFFEPINIPKNDKIKIKVLLEESLLRFQEKFGEDCNFKFITRKWLGTPKILIKIKGKPYNPIDDDGDEQIFPENVMKNLLNYEKAEIIYRYENGYNEILAFLPRKIKKLKIPGGSITISILLAIFSAFIVREFFSPQTQNILVNEILNPILKTLFGALVAVNIPLIFISIVASICNIEDVSMLNDVGTKILKRFFAMMIFITFLSIFICNLFFPVINFDFNVSFSLEIKIIFEMILSAIPQNIIEPFLSENILQVVVLAIIFGICITILGNRVEEIKILIMDLKQIIFKIVNIVFKIIPTIIFLCIFKIIVQGSTDEIFDVWRIIAAEYVLFILIPAIMLLMIKIKHGIKILDFLKKIYPAFMISFTTGSGSASIPKNIEICKNELKIDENLCDFYIPLSHAICQTSKIIGIVACVFFAAKFSGAEISIAQIFIIAFLSIQFAIAVVSCNGGMIATMSIFLTQLGFSLDAIGAITICDIFVANLSGVVALIVRDCDLLDLSKKVKI